MTNKKTSASSKERRRNALARLVAQEKSGTKTAKKSFEKTPLTEPDLKRIKNERESLSKTLGVS